MYIKMCEYTDKTDQFIVTAPTFKIMNQATFPAFMYFLEGHGKYYKKDDVFVTDWGTKCFFRTEHDPDSVVGITNVRHIWADEAGKYRLYFWENIQARAEFYGCQIDLTTSPYALNWIYRDIIRPYRKGLRPDVNYIAAASWESPYHSLHDKKKRLAKMARMDERRFRMLFGGEWTRMEGLVYDCWDDDINFCRPAKMPAGTKFYGAIDWGHTHPFVIKIRAVTPDGRHYGVSEFYKRGLTTEQMIEAAAQKMVTWGVEIFFCGHERPEHILAMNRQGIPAIAAETDIAYGISKHYELIKTGRYREFVGACPHSVDEREIYHYPEKKDLRPDQHNKEKVPVKQDDDCMDTDRYLTVGTSNLDINLTPSALPVKPKPNRRDVLMRSNRRTRAEDWSKS